MSFTAEDARKLVGKTVDEMVDDLLITIKDLATKKQRQCRCSYNHNKDNDLWVDGGYSNSAQWNEAVAKLRALGFKVDFYYSAGSSFVDMYTIVTW
jgi:hypothetical protein